MIKDRNISYDAMIEPSKIKNRIFSKEYYAALSTGAMYSYLKNKGISTDKLLSTLLLAYNKTVTGRNDAVWLSPDSNTLATTLTWANNLTHLMGMSPPGTMNLRSRLGHATNFTPMMEVSGYGNWFDRVYWMHGRGNAGNLVGLLVSGARNVFTNCHIGGPFNATEAGTAAYTLLKVTGSENYFNNCTIGADTIPRSAANSILTVDATTCERLVFENCLFLSHASSSTALFYTISGTSGDPGFNVTFKNCMFVNSIFSGSSGTALAAAFSQSGNNYTYFDNLTSFIGCTKVITGLSSYVFGGSHNTAAGTLGLAVAVGS